MVEEWRDIKGFEGVYQVSNDGRVKSLNYNKTGKEKSRELILHEHGYYRVKLSMRGKHRYYFVHRLVAEAFIPNPENYTQINHKNEVKTDNRVENLEWCDSRHNLFYGTRLERIANSKKKPVAQCDLNGRLLSVFPSAKDAYEQTGINNISACCHHRKCFRTAGGYIWKFAQSIKREAAK